MFAVFLKTNGITIVSLIYLILVIILFNLKKKNKKITGKIFNFILYVTLIYAILYSFWAILAVYGNVYADTIGRISMFCVLCWNLIQAFYITFVFNDEEFNINFLKKHKGKIIIGSIILFIINLVLSFSLSFESYQNVSGGSYHTGGFLTVYSQIVGGVAVLYSIMIFIINRKKIDKIAKKLFVLVISICLIQVILALFEIVHVNTNAFLNTMIILYLYLSIESQDKSLLAEYTKSIKKSEEISNLRSNFMKNISHQIRTPLSVIVGMGEHVLMNENMSEDEIRNETKHVKNASFDLLNLINSIFDISRLESNKETINLDNYNLDGIIFDISSNINSKIKNGLVFTINANEECPNDLYGDGFKICKILNIFLINAINSSAYGEVSLNVSSNMIDTSNYEFVFHIKNTGHAMTEDRFNISLEKIIELSDNGNIDYNMINLVVARELLDMIGGSVEFINETGMGTQYIIRLKQKVTTQNKIGNIKDKIQTNCDLSHRIVNLLGKKVLIADTDMTNIELLSKYLSQYNVIIDVSYNISDTNKLISNNDYDIIFINDNLGDMEIENNKTIVIGLAEITSNVSDKYYDVLNYPLEFKNLNKIINKIYKYGEV